MIVSALSFDLTNITGFDIAVALVGYGTVFFALVAMYLIYINIPKLINFNIRQKLRREGKESETEANLVITGEVSAAISMALYLHLNEHDDESHVLTIKNIQRSYTPWSSKIYNQNDYFKTSR